MNFKKKLSINLVLVGILPLIVVSFFSLRALSNLSKAVAESQFTVARGIIDTIDRNLFERYGDVQAFSINDAIQDRANWYAGGAESNAIVKAMNGYVRLYGVYPLMMAVDLEGKLIAANTRSAAGQAVDTSALYQRNYKDEPWFRAAVEGQFLRGPATDGTVVTDPWFDEDVARVTGGDGLALAFTAPIHDADGKVIGIWHNRADFSFVEEIIAFNYTELARKGQQSAELTLLDREGRVLVDYDPSYKGDNKIKRDRDVILRLNLAEKGVEAAKAAVAGQGGVTRGLHFRKNIVQQAGYSASQGAMGFAGLKWSALVRVATAEADAIMIHTQWVIGGLVVTTLVVVLGAAILLSVTLSKPVITGLEAIRASASEISSASDQLAASSSQLANDASSQAASLEESAAALEEVSSMVRQSSDSASDTKKLAVEARSQSEQGLASMNDMSTELAATKALMGELQHSVREMQSSGSSVAKIIKTIDEIAFQTNLLALNAAVEAARAGDAGAGFAVVADEVRNLAQRSAVAAKDTAAKIEASIERAGDSASATERVVQALAQLEAKVSQVSQKFTHLTATSRQVDDGMSSIVHAAKEQHTGISQVKTAVDEIDQLTQNNTSAAEENAAGAEELRAQSALLHQTVGDLFVVMGQKSASAQPTVSTSVGKPVKAVAQVPESPLLHKAGLAKLISPAAPSSRRPSAAPVGVAQSNDEFFEN